MVNQVIKHAESMGYDVSDLIALSNSKNPNDLGNLPRIERAFKDCELMGRQLIMHQGKLLAKAQDIFYAKENQKIIKGSPDNAYGKWQREHIGLTKKQAGKIVRFYRFVEKEGVPIGTPTTTVLAITADKTPAPIRRKFTKKLKEGDRVTEKMVKDAVKASQPKKENEDADGDSTGVECIAINVADPLDQLEELFSEMNEGDLIATRNILNRYLKSARRAA